MLQNNAKVLLMVLLAGLVTGCSTLENTFPDRKKIDYKTSGTVPSLEVPPDLTKPDRDDSMMVPDLNPSGSASFSQYAGERSAVQTGTSSRVMPEQKNVQYVREGKRHWLVLQGDPDQLWNRVRSFWLENGFLLVVDDPAVGIMETDWAENRADIPEGPIRKLLSKALDSFYSAGTRDKFRVRIERGQEAATSELFLTHRGMEEEVVESAGTTSGTVWRLRDVDPELEIEMLKRMLVFLGTEEKKAEQVLVRDETRSAPKASMVSSESDGFSLLLSEPFSRAWRNVGLGLDRVGFNVEDRDRSRGTYYVRYRDPEKETGKQKGFLSKLAFWSDDETPVDEQYQVYLQSEVSQTRVTVRDKDGASDQSPTARRILTLLQEQLQ